MVNCCITKNVFCFALSVKSDFNKIRISKSKKILLNNALVKSLPKLHTDFLLWR
jgi:hypothetical protein